MIEEMAALQAEQWTCVYCGYVYDPALGAPDSGVAPGSPWEAVPDDWCCPMCGGEKCDFQKV